MDKRLTSNLTPITKSKLTWILKGTVRKKDNSTFTNEELVVSGFTHSINIQFPVILGGPLIEILPRSM